MPDRGLLFSPAFRFALFYGAFYLGFGAYLPYMPVWFESRGLSPEMIGAAAAAGMAGRVLAAPLGALWSDRAPRRRDSVIAFAAAALLLLLAFEPARSPWLIVALAGLAGAAVTGVIPLIDAFAMGEARRVGFAFGPARAIGSATFIVGNIGCGALISRLGGEAALAWAAAGAGAALLAAIALPAGRREAGAPRPSAFSGASALLGGGLPLAFAASALIQGAHGFYYGFSAVAWRAQGVSGEAVGALWATGVAAEIVFFALSTRVFRRWSPAGLMALGGAASLARWGLLALSPPLVLLFPLQCLHAFTFAATYLGFLRHASAHAPERFAATAQAINSALSGGLVLAGATLASGIAYGAFGAGGFALMAAPAGVGLGLALVLARRGAKAS
ncbi:MFS transporter [Marinicauda salina]|uniref:MFS transporter n=1 Tax=Marinicauda salina TaxID=2135793 RepID=A0A2U2BST9_9PROT|nr:MFS transporter [Marinicauda salina]PWE17067.1 MFS transporter [Marinicauda salina]